MATTSEYECLLTHWSKNKEVAGIKKVISLFVKNCLHRLPLVLEPFKAANDYLCFMRKLSMDQLNRKSVDEFKSSEKIPVVVVLDNIRSMHNVGSVFRTADAFLLQSIYLCGYTPQPPHRDIQKTALGATETVDWKYFRTTSEAVRSLRTEGYPIVGVEQVENSIRLPDLKNNRYERLAVIFGNEVSGIDNEVLPLCDCFIEIPQWGMKHSLNISVAAGIVLWEIVRTRVGKNQDKINRHSE